MGTEGTLSAIFTYDVYTYCAAFCIFVVFYPKENTLHLTTLYTMCIFMYFIHVVVGVFINWKFDMA